MCVVCTVNVASRCTVDRCGEADDVAEVACTVVLGEAWGTMLV